MNEETVIETEDPTRGPILPMILWALAVGGSALLAAFANKNMKEALDNWKHPALAEVLSITEDNVTD